MLRTLITSICHLVLRIFFRRIEIVGRERVPAEGGVIFVVNHPNALVDPLFLLCLAPRRVSFLAKSTLLRMPVVGTLARALDTLPVYRKQDAGEDAGRNSETFAACRALLARGGTIAICPEGVSHNEPRLRPIKTGAARIALGAASGTSGAAEGECFAVKVVPVGLYYTAKTVFRSSALLHFGAPLDVPAVAAEANGEPPHEAVVELSTRIEAALGALIINAESDQSLARIAEAERIWSAGGEELASDDAPLHRELVLRRRFIEGYALHRQPSEGHAADSILSDSEPRVVLDELEWRVERYDRILRRAGVDPRDLTTIERAPGTLLRRVALRLLLIGVLLPVGFIGALLHYPAYRLAGFCANRLSRGSDDMVATIKMIAALLLFPLTWAVVAALCWLYFGVGAALLALIVLPISAYVALRFLEVEARLGEQLRVLYLAWLRSNVFTELLAEQQRIREQIARLA